jgi:hypothetical protein
MMDVGSLSEIDAKNGMVNRCLGHVLARLPYARHNYNSFDADVTDFFSVSWRLCVKLFGSSGIQGVDSP